LEFGLLLTQFSGRWDHVVADAVFTEESGLDSVWFADHLLATSAADGDAFEGWTSLAVLAGVTERVRLGHLVLAASFRNPGLLAKMVSTLDHASKGRLELGLGAGWYEREYRAFGYGFPPAAERVRYLEEYLDALELLFAGGPADYSGEFITLDQAYCLPRPLQRPRPPIVIGAARPSMLNLVGRRADVWNCPANALPSFEDALQRVTRAANGRRVRATVQIPVAVGRTPEEAGAALEVARIHAAWMGDVEEIGVVGTIDEAAKRVTQLAEMGVDGLMAVVPGSRRRQEFLSAYAELAALF